MTRLSATQILFVDSRVHGADRLLARSEAGFDVIAISPDEDGLSQIARALAGRSGLGTLNIVAQGTPGSLLLGSGTLDAAMLDPTSLHMAALRGALASDAQLHLYGSSAGEGAAGASFVDALAAASGASVAASAGLNGFAAIWGDAALNFDAPPAPQPAPAAVPAQELLFIDARVTDADTFLAQVDPSITVIRLNADEDGLTQIARALAGRSDVTAVHIVSHGDPGALHLGNITFDAAAFAGHAADLATIRGALANGADLLLYGCNVASDEKGVSFLGMLADATGADVAASTDVTGSALVGGNWALEAQVGAVQTVSIDAFNYGETLGADSQLPAGLQGNGPTWTWGGQTFQTKYNGEITTSDPLNPFRSGCRWDRYDISGIAAGTTIRVYMGNSSTVDDYLQIERNGAVLIQNDDGGDGERSYDAYLTWTYQVGDVIRATTYNTGDLGTYSLWISTSAGAATIGDIGNAPAPAPPPATAPTFTDSFSLLGTYNDTGATDTFNALTGTLTATDTTPNGGMTFSVNGSAVGSYGTLAVASNGSFAYTPLAAAINALAAGASATDTFTVRVADGGGLFSQKTITVNVVGANDAPTLASNAMMPSIAEDPASNAGATVASVFTPRFADVDSGSSLGGVVIVGNAASGSDGVWQYSTDSGTNWYSVGSVTTATGLTLAATAKLRFVPAADYNGTPGALTVHATDNSFSGGYTSGASRVSFDTTNDALTSGASVASVTLGITVTAVNDAPVFTSTAGAASITDTSAADSSFTATTGSLTGTLAASDVENDTLAYSIRGGSVASTTWTRVGLYGTLTLDSSTHAWSYAPNNLTAINALGAGQTAHDLFDFKVADAAGAYSTQTLDITLHGTNDVPLLAAALADQSFSGSGSWQYQLPAGSFTDAEGTGLTYTFDVLDGGGNVISTPSWLNFDATTRTFSGNPSAAWGDATLHLRVTATDGSASVNDSFDLTLSGTANQAPVVAAPLALHTVAATAEVTAVNFGVMLGGSSIGFGGLSPITLGTAVTGTDVATAVLNHGNTANFTVAAGGAVDKVVFTATTAGAMNDVTNVVGAGNYVSLGGGSASYNVLTQGANAVAEVQNVSFNDNGVYGETSITFDGVTIVLGGFETGPQIVSEFLSQYPAGSANWTFAASATPGMLTLTAKAAGPTTDLTDADFQDAGLAPFSPLVIPLAPPTVNGAAAIAEVFEVTYNGAFGGSTLTFDGTTTTVGSAVQGSAVAAALLAASSSISGYNVTAGGTGNQLIFTATTVGPQTDIVSSDFTGTHTNTPNVTVTTQGSNWSYQIPGGTFTDAENDTLTYAAYAIDGSGNATLIAHAGGALDFDPATRTLSGDGSALASNIIEIRATDAAGSNTTAVARLPLFLDDGSHPQVVVGNPNAFNFGLNLSGSGIVSASLPADAFFYSQLGGSLTYSATLFNGSPLPAWVSIDPTTGTFTANPPNGANSIAVKVTATDSASHSVTTSSFSLTIASPNDPLVMVAPIADLTLAAGTALNYTVSLPFSNPDGTAAGAATTAGITYTATANGQPLSTYGLSVANDGSGHLVFTGNPPGGTPYLNIVVTGTETAGGTTATTSFTLNLGTNSAGALSANNAGTVGISGTPTQGQTLTAVAPVDADGYTGTPRYQWQVSHDGGSTFTDVANSRGQQSTLTLTQDEVGQVRLQAFYTDNGGVAEAPVSNAVVIANAPDAGVVAITGSPSIGQTISAALTDADGLANATPTYQWYRGSSAGTATTAITGATYSSYTVTNADGGQFLRVVVSYTDDLGGSETPAATTSFAISLGDVAPVGVNDTGNATEAGGVNNAIAGSNATGNLLSNDTDANNNINIATALTSVRAGGTEGLGATASDNGTTFTIAGLYGTLVVTKATGAYVYTIDNNNDTVQALNVGGTLVDSFNYTLQDATLLSDTAVLAITLHGANDAISVQDLAATAAFTEDIVAQLRTDFTLVDPDPGVSFALKMEVSAGRLIATGNANVTVAGNDTGTLIVTGTMADVQNWLADGAVQYLGAANANGSATLTYSANDGSGYVVAGSTTLNIAAVNDAAVLDLNGSNGSGNNFAATFRPRGSEVAVVDTDLLITDIDDTMLTGATVAITAGAADNGFGTMYETLRSSAGSSFVGGNGHTITISGNGTTTLTFSGNGTHAEYEALLKTVLYNNTNPNAYSGDRTITFTLTDAASTGSNGALASNGASFTTLAANNAIAVGQHIWINGADTGFVVAQVVDNQHFVASAPLTGLAPGSALSFYAAGAPVTTAVQSGLVAATTTVSVPWAPVIDLNGDSGSGRNHAVTYTEGGAAVALATADASITDQDGNIAQVVLTLSNPQDGSNEKLTISGALVTQLNTLGITVSGNDSHAITLSGNRDATYFQVALRAVKYVNLSENPGTTDRVVLVTSTDVDGNTGVGAQTVITVHAVNDAPDGIDSTVTTIEDSGFVFSASHFGFSDPVDGGANTLAAVKVSTLPTFGTLTLDGVAVTAGQTISVADLNAGKLMYMPGADRSGLANASFTFQVQDNGGTLYGGVDLDPTPATMTINVTGVNDAPILLTGGADFATLTEDDVANNGQLVGSVLSTIIDMDTANGLPHAANNGTLTGMAVHAATVGAVAGGTWQYNLNDSTGWHNVGAVSDTAALLLRASDRVRFVPDAIGGTTGTLSYYAWDQSTGSAGSTVNVTSRGGSTAYSFDSDSAGITVTDVNDAPTISVPGTMTVAEDASIAITGLSFGDVDITGRVDGDTTNDTVSVSIEVGHGTLALLSTAGVSFTGAANGSARLDLSGSLAAINAAVATLVYTPAADFHGSDTVSAGINDHGNVGAGVALSAASSFGITVTPTNDAPTMVAAAGVLPTITEDAVSPAGSLVSSFATGISDIDGGTSATLDGNAQGIAVYALHNDGPATGGTWQYSVNGGSSWLAVGTVSSTQALLLRSTDLVRFVPDGQNATAASIDFYAWDGASGTQGNKVDASSRGGSSAFSTASDSAHITVTAVNDAPVIDLDGNNSSGATGTGFVTIFRARGDAVAVVDADITITDPDRTASGNDTLTGATLKIATGDLDNLFGTTYETLYSSAGSSYAGSLGAITFSGDGTSANPLLLSGAGTWADYQNALKTVVYRNTNPNAFAGDRTVQISVHDAAGPSGGVGSLESAIATTTIHAVWAPVADLDGSATAGRDYAVSFTEGQSGVAIAASNASIVDQDGNIATVTVTLTNPLNGGYEELFISSALVTQLAAAGITVSNNHTHTITLSGNRDGTTFQLGLRAIQYVNTLDNPASADRVVSVAMTDQSGNTGVGANTVISIVGINDVPVGANTSLTLLEDTPKVFAVADFPFTDVENDALLSVRITTLPTAGVLTLDGVAVTAGQFVSAADIAAGKLVFTPAANANEVQNPNGSGAYASLSFQVRDAGGTANGGVDLDATPRTMTIHVTPVNDLPTGGVTIAGVLRVGDTLTAPDTIADVDGLAARSYQWQTRSLMQPGTWVDVGGATGSSYTLAAGDANLEVRVVVSYADTNTTTVLFSSDIAGEPALVADSTGVLNVSTDFASVQTIRNPLGPVTVNNTGTGTFTIDGLANAQSVTTLGTGPVVVNAPLGSLNLVSQGSVAPVVNGLLGTATLFASGSGPLTVAAPASGATVSHSGSGTTTVTGVSGTLNTAGSGAITVAAPAAGASVIDTGNGAVTVNNPAGALAASNGNGGTLTINGAATGSTVTTSGSVSLANPVGSLTLAGSGSNTVSGLTGSATLTATGSGATSVTAPASGATLVNNGSGTTTASGVSGTLNTAGSGATVVSAPAAGATVSDTGSGPVTINNPAGSLSTGNAGGGTLTVNGAASGSTVTSSGSVTLANPLGSLTLAGSGDATVSGLLGSATLTSTGSGDTSVVAPASGATLVNNGSGTTTASGVNGTLNTAGSGATVVSAPAAGSVISDTGSGPVTVNNPAGSLATSNAGGGSFTVNHPAAGSTVSSSGTLTIADPLGSLTLAGSGDATVNGLLGSATLTSTGSGSTTVASPASGATVSNNGSGTLSVNGVTGSLNTGGSGATVVNAPANGAVISDSGSGPVTVNNPAGSLGTSNAGGGSFTVNHPAAGSTVTTSGSVTLADPLGSLTLAGSGNNTVNGLPGSATLTTTGSGATNVVAPGSGATLVNNGSGITTASGVSGTLNTAGSSATVVDSPASGTVINDTGSGPLTVNSPQGELGLTNAGGGSAIIQGAPNGATLTTSGDVMVINPAGSLTLVNQGGTATLGGVPDGALVHTLGSGNTTLANPLGNVLLNNDGPGLATVSGLPAGGSVTTLGAGATRIVDPLGDVSVDNQGSGLVTARGLANGSTIAAHGSGALEVDMAGMAAPATVTVAHDGSGAVSVLHAPDGATLHSTGSSPLTVVDPLGALTLDNTGTALVALSGAADGAVLTANGSGPVSIVDPRGNLALHHDGSGLVTVSGMHDGETLALQGSGPVLIETQLGSGQHITVDTGGNPHVQIHNTGDGTIDVTGPLVLGSDAALSLQLNNLAGTPLTAHGVVIDGTPLVLDLHFTAALGDHVTLVSNTGSGAVSGQFAGMPEGSSFYLGGHLFSISYVGGDGNDIVLSRVNDGAQGSVTLSGSAVQGAVLTAAQNLTDSDGMGTVSLSWLRGDTVVGTGASYTLGQADVGAAIKAVATYTDGQGTAERVVSAASATVANVNDAPTGSVRINGTPIQGRTLTASQTLADLDGLGAITYQWLAGNQVLGTGSSYTLGQDDVGRSIQLVAQYTDGFGAVEQVASAVGAPVANVNDAPTGSVTISGTADQGQTLNASNSLADIDGLGSISYSWLRGSTVVGSGSSYTLGQADVGAQIRVQASYTDGFGTPESVLSGATRLVNGVSSSGEAAAPAIRTGSVAGDGNGDGIADVDQLDVASSAVHTVGTTSVASYVTLVAGSAQGQTTGSGAQVTTLTQSDTFVAPPMADMRLGEISFVSRGGTAPGSFSLYLDASLNANGFWVHDAQGTLVNLASAAYGGQVVQEGDRTRLDFTVADGSRFDADAVQNGEVALAGLAGHMPLSLIAYQPDLPTDGWNTQLFWG